MDISAAAARRIALAAQGFTDDRPSGRVDARHLRRVMSRVGCVQLDALNVLCRMHYATVFARLGPYPRELFDRMAWGGPQREWFEYWGLAASVHPVDRYPLLRWRMERVERDGWTPGGMKRLNQLPAGFVDDVLADVAEHGPTSAGAITPENGRTRGGMFNWSDTKLVLEWLFITGRVSIASRPNFTRMYDLTERVLPPDVVNAPTPPADEAQRELIRIAARAYGVATETDLFHYWYFPRDETQARIAELVEEGELLPVRVESWRAPAYLWHQARIPRYVHARALLSPFDTLLGGRSRGPRLFDFDHYIEFYRPQQERVWGYFVVPFLLGDRPVGRVDLKADRQASTLLVQAAHAEPDVDKGQVATELAIELRKMATWLNLERIKVTRRGDLAPALARTRP